jgi:hypothetical protein
MLSFSDKLLLSTLVSFSLALLFSTYELYFKLLFPIPFQIYIILEVFILSIPFYFLLVNTEEGILGFFSGFIFYFLKSLIFSALKFEQVCIFDSLIFSLSFSILTFSIAFHREQSLKNVKLSLLGSFVVFLAFISSIFILLVYYNYFSEGLLCFYPQAIFLAKY